MSQTGLDFGPLHRSADAARRTYRALNESIDGLGLGTMADALGIDDSDLRRALDRRKRGVWVEYALAIGSMAPELVRAQLATALVEPLGYGIAPLRPLTEEERRVRLENRVVAAFGPAGLALVEENKR